MCVHNNNAAEYGLDNTKFKIDPHFFFKKNTHQETFKEISWLFPHLNLGNGEISLGACNMPTRGRKELRAEESRTEGIWIDFTFLFLTLSQYPTLFLFLYQISNTQIHKPWKTHQCVTHPGLLQLLQEDDAFNWALSHPTQH